MHPGISVIIPAYNAARWLPRALASVQAQSYPAAEVIVVDDGSTDATAEVAQRFVPSVSYMAQPNAGVSAARNRGLAAAMYEWVAFLDADDEWLPHKLQRQMTILEADSELRWCTCAYENVYGATPPDRPGSAHPAAGRPAGSRLAFFEAAARALPLQTSGFVIHCSVFAEVGGFNPALRVGEDRDLWCRIALRHPLLGYCPQIGYRYAVDTPASLMKGVPERSAAVRCFCELLRRVPAGDPAVARAYYTYARWLVHDYLLRAAGREVRIEKQAAREARRVFPLTLYQRLAMAGLASLPAGLARRVLRRVSL